LLSPANAFLSGNESFLDKEGMPSTAIDSACGACPLPCSHLQQDCTPTTYALMMWRTGIPYYTQCSKNSECSRDLHNFAHQQVQ